MIADFHTDTSRYVFDEGGTQKSAIIIGYVHGLVHAVDNYFLLGFEIGK